MMRLSGLASGMDTDSMVKQLMKAEQIKVDRVKQERQILEWKKETYNSLNKDFANFILKVRKDFGYNNITRRPGSMDWIRKATSSDEKIATATAGKGAFGGEHKVNVKTLAKGVEGVSKVDVKNSDWEAKKSTEGIGDFEFTINGKKVSVAEGDNMSTIARKINGAGVGVQASYDETLGKFFIRTEKQGINEKIEFKGFEVKDENGVVDADKTDANQKGINGFLNTINVELKLYSYNETTKQEDTLPVETLQADREYKGSKGSVVYNGVETVVNSNSFTFNGVNFNVKEEKEFTVRVETNIDEAIDKITSFIEEYNNLIEKAGSLLREKSNRNYKPLTEDERGSMTENDIKLWEIKAKSGILRNDTDISDTLSKLRTDLYKDVNGATGNFKGITEIGITTKKYESGAIGGKLQVDEDKLRSALERDPDSVLEVLFNEHKDGSIVFADDTRLTQEQLAEKRAQSGLVTRIFDNLTVGMKGLISKSGLGDENGLFQQIKSNLTIDFATSGGRFSKKGSVSDIDDELSKYDRKIDDLTAYLLRRENSYYAKFTAMEKAMQKASSQSGWLMQQFGGSSN